MDKMLKVALILTAIDKMSGVVNSATNAALKDLDRVDKGVTKMRDGFMMMAAGKQGFDLLAGPIESYGKLEAAGNRLKTSIMTDGGLLDAKTYDKMIEKSQELSEKYANNSAEYLNMMRLLKNNGIEEADILGQIGEATEQLAVAMDVGPSQAAVFVAHMKRDMGIANKDMMGMMDLIARLYNVGVGESGADAINQMNQFFSKEGLSAAIMKSLGLEEAKAVSAIAGLFIRRGLSGQTVGTNFRRMLDTMRNPKAMKEVNDEAKKFGITLDLFDEKTNKWKGFTNLIKQFDKLKNLPVQVIDQITHAFGGRQGLSNDFIALLSTEGTKDFNELIHHLERQAYFTDKNNVLVSGQEYRVKRMHAAWENAKAAIGQTLAPTFEILIQKLTKAVQWLGEFTRHHPTVSRYIATFVGIASAVIMFAGAMKVLAGSLMVVDGLLRITAAIKWMRIAMAAYSVQHTIATGVTTTFAGAVWASTAALLANPITWIVLAVIALVAAVLLIIKHWKTLAPFFKGMWEGIKMAFFAAVGFVKKLLWDWQPAVLIYKNWGSISKWFHKQWEAVKQVFLDIILWFAKLHVKFVQAGYNIISSIALGIMKGMHKVIDKVKDIATKIRSYFPFSPAKEGPLRDIHRIRLIETISEAIRPDAILSKMKSVAGAIFDFQPSQTAQSVAGGVGGAAGGQIVIAPVFHYHAAPGAAGGSGQQDMNAWMRKNVRVMVDMLQDEMRRRNRAKYD